MQARSSTSVGSPGSHTVTAPSCTTYPRNAVLTMVFGALGTLLMAGFPLGAGKNGMTWTRRS